MKVSGTVKRHQGDYNQQSSDYRKPYRTIIWFLPGKTIKEENKGDPKRRFTKLEENATKIYKAYLVQNSLVESMQFCHNLFFFSLTVQKPLNKTETRNILTDNNTKTLFTIQFMQFHKH